MRGCFNFPSLSTGGIFDSARFMAPQGEVQRWGSAVASSTTKWNWFPVGLPAFWHLRTDLNPYDKTRKEAKTIDKGRRDSYLPL